MKKNYVVLLFLLLGISAYSQNAVKVFIEHFEASDTFPAHVPIYAKLLAMDTKFIIDTTYNGNVNVQLIQGSGALSGTLTVPFVKGQANFTDIILDVPDTYRAVFTSGSLEADTTKPFVIDNNIIGYPTPGDTARYAEIIKDGVDTLPVNMPFNLYVAATTILGSYTIDTLVNSSVTLGVVGGGTTLKGNAIINFSKGIALFYDLAVNTEGKVGLYTQNDTLISDTIWIVFSNMMGPSVKATRLKIENEPVTIKENAPFSITVRPVDDKESIDFSYHGSASISKLEGPGVLKGTTTVNFSDGMAIFNNIWVDTAGDYRFILSAGDLLNDTTQNIHADTSSIVPVDPHPPGCSESTAGERNNLGLYGGSSYDLTYAFKNKRLFAAIETPASVFLTDDTCKTWIAAFPDDSLEYDCGQRGWGGGGVNILTNTVGWVAIQTAQQGGTLNSSVISFHDGDTGTWRTAVDEHILGLSGVQPRGVSSIALSDYYMYVGATNHLCRLNGSSPYASASLVVGNLEDIGTISNPVAKSLAAANSPSGYPLYIAVTDGGNYGSLYKYNGSNYTLINLPTGEGVEKVFTHPGQSGGDTLIIVTRDSLNDQTISVYRSLNGGSDWTDISYPTNFSQVNVDYSPNWVSSMPTSNGVRISLPGLAVSDNLGSNWTTFQLTNNGGATHPDNPNLVVGTEGRGVVYSTTGAGGPYILADNYGLEAVKIYKIAHSAGKGVFYLTTSAGLAYTTAYNDSLVDGFDKWNAPHGMFPVEGAGGIGVAIDPSDSNHVIVGGSGYPGGFYVTTTGPTGFSSVVPANWDSSVQQNPNVQDVMFVNSSIVLAVTGTGQGWFNSGPVYGNIWRSANGGTSWTLVTPTGFQQGTALAMGTNETDTVLYATTGADGGPAITNGSLWASDDLGLTWTKVNDGPVSSANPGITNLPIWDVAVDPRGTDTVYLASGSNLDYGFVVSKDGGSTYEYPGIRGEGSFTSVMVNQEDPDLVYTAIRREIYMYNLATDKIFLIFRGLPGELIPDLAYGSVLAGTNTGFFKIKEQIIEEGSSEVISPYLPKANGVKVYPIPFSNEINIDWNGSDLAPRNINIIDALGRIVHNSSIQGNMTNAVVNLEYLPSGYYIVQLVCRDKIVNVNVVK